MKVKIENEVTQPCLTLSDPMDHSLPGSSIHGIFQARALGGVPLPSPSNRYSPKKILKGNKNLGEGRNLVARIKSRVLPVRGGLQVKIRSEMQTQETFFRP